MNTLVKAITNSNSPLDLSNIQPKYIYDNIKYDSPFISFLVENKYYLLSQVKEVEMDSRYEFRPDYVSYDFYGTTNLWYLILFVNGLNSIIEFTYQNIDTILVPSLDKVNNILYRYRNKKNIQKLYHQE